MPLLLQAKHSRGGHTSWSASSHSEKSKHVPDSLSALYCLYARAEFIWIDLQMNFHCLHHITVTPDSAATWVPEGGWVSLTVHTL